MLYRLLLVLSAIGAAVLFCTLLTVLYAVSAFFRAKVDSNDR